MDDLTISATGDQPTCRICRSEGTPEEPLFHPCRCSGSIRNVHQDCLVEWLSHSQKKHCELCKTPYRFTKLYDAGMPSKLPWRIFIQQAILQLLRASLRIFRVILVSVIWLILLPWAVRWTWRWLFWFADAGWARDVYLTRLYKANPALLLNSSLSTSASNSTSWVKHILGDNHDFAVLNKTAGQPLDGPNRMKLLFSSFGIESFLSNDTASVSRMPWKQSDVSIFSSVSYISALTPYPSVNRVIIDIFEGQLITCTVILAFILIFLIREWVVQQQPIVNLDQLNVQREQDEQNRRERQRIEAEAWNRLAELEIAAAARQRSRKERIEEDVNTEDMISSSSSPEARRPRMPDRQSSSRATNIQRILADTDIVAAPDANTPPETPALKVSTSSASANPNKSPARPKKQRRVRQRTQLLQATKDDLPIANAGPDSKLNIKLAASQPLRFPQIDQTQMLVSMNELRQRLNQAEEQLHDLTKDDEFHDSTSNLNHTQPSGGDQASSDTTSAPPQPDNRVVLDDTVDEYSLANNRGPETVPVQIPHVERQNSQHEYGGHSIPGSTADVIETNVDHLPSSTRDTIDVRGVIDSPNMVDPGGRDDASDIENAVDVVDPQNIPEQAAIDPQDLDLRTEEERAVDAAEKSKKSTLDLLLDWFWDDIQPSDHSDQVIVIDEQQLGLGDADLPEPLAQPPQRPDQNALIQVPQHENGDPEVVAAAQQAGIDAEAVDDAEDIEGLMELIGLRGPLAGLIQTAAFCLTMVICTVLAAVILPYFWGKLVLGFIGNPLYFLITLPLQTMSFLTDFLVDIVLFVGSAVLCALTFWTGYITSAAQSLWPRLGDLGSWIVNISNIALAEASASGNRLRGMLDAGQSSGSVPVNSMLSASLHSHLALKDLLAEIDAVLHFFSSFVRGFIDLMITADLSKASSSLLQGLSTFQAWGLTTTYSIAKSFSGFSSAISGLRSGNLTLPSAPMTSQIDPALVYWSSTDRSLAVFSGYMAIAVIASVYVALDTPITRSPSGQKTEKMIRDSLRQAGGVFKVILIISIEMLVFPFYCGALLDLAFLPLFSNSTFASRLAFALARPYIFCFVHWFVGTCYMFHFALFVGMCRKILRKGVLWFIRDPDDPTFHPVRDVLERNVTTQLRKIAFSALVYGALVILCLGGVIWTIGKVFTGIFPVHWAETEPLLEFPVDLLLYNFLTPLAIRLMKPGDIVQAMYAWWLKRCARVLRLSHFLFDDRKEDEEKVSEHGDFKRMLYAILAMWTTQQPERGKESAKSSLKDGKWVLTPCTDQFKVPKPDEYYLHLNHGDDMHIADKNGKRNDQFARIYVPPRFRFRMTLFMVCLWVFTAFIGMCATLLPLIFGRSILRATLPDVTLNDIYAYTIGAALLSALAFVVTKGRGLAKNAYSRVAGVARPVLINKVSKLTKKITKSVLIYGFIAIILPTILAISVETYVMIPLHTYLASIAAGVPRSKNFVEFVTNLSLDTANLASIRQAWNQSDLLATMLLSTKQPVVHHVHFVEDFALGIFFLRLLARLVFSDRSSRAAEALRRATENGPFDLDLRIARRFLILPSLVLAAIVLAGPPTGAWMSLNLARMTGFNIDTGRQTEVYRYSYPFATTLLCTISLLRAIGFATSKWRSRIRDEVYLVGERLHNYGESRPPAGSRSIIRRA